MLFTYFCCFVDNNCSYLIFLFLFFHRWMKLMIAGIHWAFPNLTYILTLIAKLTTHLWWRCLSAIVSSELISYLYYSLIHNLLFDIYSACPKISFHQQKRHRLRYVHLMRIFNSQLPILPLPIGLETLDANN